MGRPLQRSLTRGALQSFPARSGGTEATVEQEAPVSGLLDPQYYNFHSLHLDMVILLGQYPRATHIRQQEKV